MKCRSVLEISSPEIIPTDPSELSLMRPDAVVVMMNPGSSHPKDLNYTEEQITYPQSDGAIQKRLLLTQPDNTQYQIMRVALVRGWRHIRVLNLSDLRDPKSMSFIRRVEALSEKIGGNTHSIFSPERAAECTQALKRKIPTTPILLGWGRDEGLLPLATRCMACLEGEPLCFVPAGGSLLLNAHPSPMLQTKKLFWLESMLQSLESKSD